jgi:hypothetical protein
MNNRVKSLEVRNEVIKLIKEKFNLDFGYSFNDLYKVKDNNVVRRLKGNLYNVEENKYYYYLGKDSNKEFNDLVLKIDNFVKELDYKDFKIRLKRKVVCVDEYERNSYEKIKNKIISMKEYREMIEDNERDLILSIRFEDI